MPAVLIVDLGEESILERSLLDDLLADPQLGHLRTIEVGGSKDSAMDRSASRAPIRVASPEQLPAVLHALLGDAPELSRPEDGLFPVAANEGQRLAALERSGLVGTQPEEAFDRLIWLASHSLASPVALMTVLTPTRQWFKSRRGLELTETPRSWAFCNYTLLQRDVMVVEDLALDERFTANPAVMGAPHCASTRARRFWIPMGLAWARSASWTTSPAASITTGGKRCVRWPGSPPTSCGCAPLTASFAVR
jgi:hypothetical protein